MFFISSVKCHSVRNMCRVGQLSSKPLFNDELIQPSKQAKTYPAESDGTHKLHTAARQNDIEVINYFIESGYELDDEDSSGTTPFVAAVLHDNYRAAAMLHNARVDLFARQLYGQNESLIPWSFTQRAMIRLTADIVAKLKSEGLNAAQTGDILARVSCCLDEVVRLHDPAMTKAFLESDCSPNYGENQTIFRIVIPRFDVRHVEVLLHHGSELESRRLEFFRVLMDNIAHYRRQSEAGRRFLRQLFSWRVLNETTLLEYLELALNRANAESVKIFLQYGYHAVAKAKCGRDVLACLYGNPNAKVVLFLKGEDMDVEGRGYEGKTPLHFAVQNDVPENVQFLLDRAADADAFDEAGNTPLMDAFAKLDKSLHERPNDKCSLQTCAQLLLQSRANPLLCNSAGETIFDYGNLTFGKCIALAKLAVGQLAVYEALGHAVDQHIAVLVALHDHLKLPKYYEECRQQLRQLKAHEIRGAGDTRMKQLTMFQILTDRAEKLARCLNEDDSQTIASFLKKYNKKKMHYYEALKGRIGVLEKLKHCRDIAIDVISECTEKYDPHHLFVDNIVDYLNDRDLLKFK